MCDEDHAKKWFSLFLSCPLICSSQHNNNMCKKYIVCKKVFSNMPSLWSWMLIFAYIIKLKDSPLTFQPAAQHCMSVVCWSVSANFFSYLLQHFRDSMCFFIVIRVDINVTCYLYITCQSNSRNKIFDQVHTQRNKYVCKHTHIYRYTVTNFCTHVSHPMIPFFILIFLTNRKSFSFQLKNGYMHIFYGCSHFTILTKSTYNKKMWTRQDYREKGQKRRGEK